MNEWIICIGEAAGTGVYGIVDTLTISSHGAFYAGDSALLPLMVILPMV